MRGVTNYRKGQSEFPQASESYISVQGKPTNENIFGNNISCGTAVDFFEEFSINDDTQLNKFVNLFNEIDTAMKFPARKSSFPRVTKVKKKESLTEILDKVLLDKIINEDNGLQVYFDVNKIQLVGNRIEIINNQETIKAYILHNKKDTLKEINIDSEDISDFVKYFQKRIKNVSDLKIDIVDENNMPIKSGKDLKDFIYCEVRYDNQYYILENGYWCYFNDKFYELLRNQLDDINENIVEVDHKYSINYSYENSGEWSGEGGYIEELCKDNNMVKLHKRFISFSDTKIEIADAYDRKKDELIAIKRGVKTNMSLYSFEQSILSMQALANQEEFKVYEGLKKYNDSKEYKDIKIGRNIQI